MTQDPYLLFSIIRLRTNPFLALVAVSLQVILQNSSPFILSGLISRS